MENLEVSNYKILKDEFIMKMINTIESNTRNNFI